MRAMTFYAGIAVMTLLAAVAFIMAKIGIEGSPPESEFLFFGGGFVLGGAIICFLFWVLPSL
jgi:hypothetical protein